MVAFCLVCWPLDWRVQMQGGTSGGLASRVDFFIMTCIVFAAKTTVKCSYWHATRFRADWSKRCWCLLAVLFTSTCCRVLERLPWFRVSRDLVFKKASALVSQASRSFRVLWALCYKEKQQMLKLISKITKCTCWDILSGICTVFLIWGSPKQHLLKQSTVLYSFSLDNVAYNNYY